MSEFVGVLPWERGAVDPAIIARMGGNLAGGGAGRCVVSGRLALRHLPLRHDDWRLAAQPLRIGGDALVVADCRLDEPGEIAAALGLDGQRRDDAFLVAAACQRWGLAAAERLNGSFAFAHWDEAADRLVLARDGLGTRSLFYVEHPHYLIFASSLQTLLALPEVSREIDDVVLAQYLTIQLPDNETTIYRHIRRVPPGGMVVVERGRLRKSLYWTVDHIAPVRFKRDDDYVAAGRALLDRAVACRLPTDGRLGVQLSGGLDSTGLAATAARLLGDTGFDAFHRRPGAPHSYEAMDERALVGAVVARYPTIALTVIDGDKQYAADIEPEIDAAKYVVPRARGLNASWFEPIKEAARATGVSVMFSGGCGNATLSWGGRPHFANDVLTGHWGRAWRSATVAAGQRRQSLPRFLAGHFVKPLLPRTMMVRRAQRAAGDRSPWALYSMVSDDFLASIDYAALTRGTDHDVPFQGKVVDKVARFRGLQDQRNRDKRAANRRAGDVATVDPYADRRLVEFTLGVPNSQYWNGGEDRWLARRVLADRLPAELVAERRRGVQCPEWYELASRRREGMAEAVERIGRSPLASRVVDVPRMKALLDDWPDAETAMSQKQVYGYALARGISIGGFLRWYEGGNE